MAGNNKAWHYLLCVSSIIAAAVIATALGINNGAVKAIVLITAVVAYLGGINTFMYYLAHAVLEAGALFIYSFLTKSYVPMYLPLVPVGYSVLMFIIQVVSWRKRS